jgi:hypothetical protein
MALDVALHGVQLADQFDGLAGDLALVGSMQFDELAPSVRLMWCSP